MADMGRPPKFTPQVRTAIIDCISDRIPYDLAALSNGVSPRRFYEWLKQGLIDLDAGIESDYANFSQGVKNAEVGKMRFHLDKISENIERWQADAWILERRWWKHFSPNAAVVEFNKRLDAMEKRDDEIDSGEEKQNSEK